jgi:protein-tyrosine phosphatase
MAEAVFKNKIEKAGLSNQIIVDSCGTASYHIGSMPDHRTLKTLSAHGIEFKHYARAFSVKDFENFDIIYAMDRINYENIIRQAKTDTHRDKVKIFRSLDNLYPESDTPDPYYGDMSDFEHVFEICDRCADAFLREMDGVLVLKNKARPS